MDRTHRLADARGYSLAELMIVLVVLSLGVLAIAKLFPTATREQEKDKLRTAASYHAQEKLEALRTASSTDADLADGRHPDDTTNESLGGTMERYWTVSHLPDPLANLARLDVVVRWNTARGSDSTTATTYVDH